MGSTGQHPKPYQPAITFLDTMGSLQPLQPPTPPPLTANNNAKRRNSFPIGPTPRPESFHSVKNNQNSLSGNSFQQQKGPTPKPEKFHSMSSSIKSNQNSMGANSHLDQKDPTPKPENIPSVNNIHNINSFQAPQEFQPNNYDPFAFNSQTKASTREGFVNDNNFVDFGVNTNNINRNHQNHNSAASGAERRRSARPADTKYSPAADPRHFFNNKFHASDRFFDKFSVDTQTINDNFKSPKGVTGGGESYHGETQRDNGRKLDFTKEKRNLNSNGNKETEKMRSLRSKLFDGREPGGYYIKVFNNDGNNYSIRDGKIPRNEGDGQLSVGSNKQNSGQNPHPLERDQTPGPGSGVPGPEWRNDKHWNHQEFQSRELSKHFPFLF